MPYIEIRAYPKDEATKELVAQRIKDVFLEEWGCPEQAISISFEEFKPEEWEEKVGKSIIEKNRDKMYLMNGKKMV